MKKLRILVLMLLLVYIASLRVKILVVILGWIKSNQISKEIYSEIQDKEIIKPFKTGNGYLILKINDKKKS